MRLRKYFLVSAIYLFLALILYSPVLGSFFVSDDFDWLARAKEIPLTWQNYLLSNADGHQDGGVYRPLTSASFWLNYQINELSPTGYYLVNVVFHGLNAFLVFWLVMAISRQFASSGNIETRQCLVSTSFLAGLPAGLAGLFFLILPNHSEAVAWLSSRGDVLTTFFYLLSLISYLYFRERKKIVFLFFSLLAFALALGAKEMAITLPLVIIALEFVIHRVDKKTEPKNIWTVPPFFVLLFGYFLLRYKATGLFLGYYASADLSFSRLTVIETFIRSSVSNFLVGAPRQLVSGFLVGHWVLFGLFLLIVCLLWFHFWKKNRRLRLFAALFFFLTLLPVLNLSLSRLTDEGERLVYLSSVGIALLLAIFVKDILSLIWRGYKQFSHEDCLSERSERVPQKRIVYIPAKIIGIVFFIFLILYFSFSLFQKNLNWQRAGQLSQNLLTDFAQQTNLMAGEGLVFLGLPDNLEGAFVFRNGWLNALKLIYPTYLPDVLAVKAGLNLTRANFNKKVTAWENLPDGFQATALSLGPLFRGKQVLNSLDYSMEIKDYEPRMESGGRVEFHFMPLFRAQTANKAIRFFMVEDGNFKELASF